MLHIDSGQPWFFFSFIFISWRLITLQYCSGFCHTLTWISHGFTYIPHPDPLSRLPLYPLPLGLPSAPGPSTCLMHPTCKTEKETQMYRTDFWTLWEKARVGCFKRTTSKHVYYLGWNNLDFYHLFLCMRKLRVRNLNNFPMTQSCIHKYTHIHRWKLSRLRGINEPCVWTIKNLSPYSTVNSNEAN